MNDAADFQEEDTLLEQAAMGGAVLEFVVLRHTGTAEPHYDLLLKLAGKERLLTWRVGVGPTHWAELLEGQLGAVRTADHRAVYLTYQGEISEGRGVVERVAAGTALLLELTAAALRLRLHLSALTIKPVDVVVPRQRPASGRG